MKRSIFLKTTGCALAYMFFRSPEAGAGLPLSQQLAPLLKDQSGKPITSPGEWIRKREMIKRVWSEYLGIIAPNPEPPVIRIMNEDNPEGLIRQYIEYEGEPGIRVKAYLLKPRKHRGRLPAAVALHSTGDNQMRKIAGLETSGIESLGYNLAKRGFVVICPMCFLWHEKGSKSYEEQVDLFRSRHPQSKGMAKMLYDAMRAVDVLEQINEVDKKRIGALGHSLGAKEAFYLGAFDDRVSTIVSNEGGIAINSTNWDDPWYLGREIHDFPHQHHEVLGLCAPKAFLLIGGDSSDGKISEPYIDAVKPVYELFGKPENLMFFNHGKGHGITPEAEKITYNWMLRHLKEKTD
ncbi:MAG TPA: dienelactone hydrolase family protein [Bacteroidales bacterium]|nr:dienelactone hydrolase family protein [Bacteroidales bacterium]